MRLGTTHKINIVKVFDSDLDALFAMHPEHFIDETTRYYAQVMIYYLSGKNSSLGLLVKDLQIQRQLSSEHEMTWLLAKARLQIRKGEVSSDLFKELESCAHTQEVWRGEIYFVLSTMAITLGQHHRDRIFSDLAFHALKSIGAPNKAIRALMNRVAAESCIYPENHYLSDLYYIYREAKKIGDRTSVGTTLMNISREYQKLGAYTTALKYANRAIAMLARNAGNFSFHLALAHRCHLFCQLGSFVESITDAERARSCEFSEVHFAIDTLEKEFPTIAKLLHSQRLLPSSRKSSTPTWKERKEEGKFPQLTPLEQKLIELIAERPRGKLELIEKLYGTRLPLSSTQNRLHNLINRVRKRFSRLIIFIQGKYRLREKPILET